jgi:hypothetical protein
MKRRDFLQGLAAVVRASSVLGHYTALAAPLRKNREAVRKCLKQIRL